MAIIRMNDGVSRSVRIMEYRHGRHEVTYEPDLCGRLNVVLGPKRPDRVTISMECRPEVADRLELEFDSGHRIRIRVVKVVGERIDAEVCDGIERS